MIPGSMSHPDGASSAGAALPARHRGAIQLLERREIPFHKIGTHRRVRYQDVFGYEQQLDAQRHDEYLYTLIRQGLTQTVLLRKRKLVI